MAGWTWKDGGLVVEECGLYVGLELWVLCVGGAIDCTVVRVVASDRTDGAGDEKVLSRPPSVRGAVWLVPAPDGAASERVVSAVVAKVGALDLLGI